MGFVHLHKRSRERPCPFHPLRTQRDAGGLQPGREPSPEPELAGTLTLDSSASGTMRKKSLFISAT